MELGDHQWYVVLTQAGAEHSAAVELRQLGYRVLYLHTTEWTAGSSKTKSRLFKRPYLSRYIFVGLTDEAPFLTPVAGVRGVSALVMSPGGEPFPVPLKAMELITASCNLSTGEVFPGQKRRRFAGGPGDTVILGEKSPLQGFMAEILSVDTDQQITVIIEAFGRKVPTKVGLDKVDALLSPSGEPIDKLVTVTLTGPKEAQA